MILYLNPSMASIALRVKELGGERQVTSWEDMQLIIQPPIYGPEVVCHMGSPMYFIGCWPLTATGVDIANSWIHHDFPAICYHAHELDLDGRIVFLLDDRLWKLPTGRYHGELRLQDRNIPPVLPFNIVHDMRKEALPKHMVLPPGYESGADCCLHEDPPQCHPPVHPCACVIAEFDIDLGPACHEHVIDQVVTDYIQISCEANHG